MTFQSSTVQRRVIAFVAFLALVLVGLAVYFDSRPVPIRSGVKTSFVLRLQLKALRLAMGRYHERNHAYPHQLNDLVTDGEIHAIPIDPVTRSGRSWKLTTEERVPTDEFSTQSRPSDTVIVDVHSGASGKDSAGRAWSEY